jgi:hypothetical protein
MIARAHNSNVTHHGESKVEPVGRLSRGILIAPLLPAFILSLGALGSYATFSAVVSNTFLFYLPCVVATALIGFPIFYFLRRMKLVRWWSASACGLVGGALVFVAPAGLRVFNLARLRSDWHELLIFSSLGAATAFVVWMFWWFNKQNAH